MKNHEKALLVSLVHCQLLEQPSCLETFSRIICLFFFVLFFFMIVVERFNKSQEEVK